MGGDEVPKISSAEISDKFSDYFRLIFNVFSFTGVLSFLKMVSNLERFDFSVFISGVMNGLRGRERKEVVNRKKEGSCK